MRQLDTLRQIGSVAEYYASFEQLSHQILLYNNSYDDVFFVTHFLNGLKDEIRSAFTLHRPQTVDTASSLALLQEHELSRHSLPVKTSSRVFTADKPKTNSHKSEKSVSDKKMGVHQGIQES